jgi:hypothetical protein
MVILVDSLIDVSGCKHRILQFIFDEFGGWFSTFRVWAITLSIFRLYQGFPSVPVVRRESNHRIRRDFRSPERGHLPAHFWLNVEEYQWYDI